MSGQFSWYPLLRLFLGFGVKKVLSITNVLRVSNGSQNVCRDVPFARVEVPRRDWGLPEEEEEDEKGESCVCCQFASEEEAKDELIKVCNRCQVFAHGSCFNRWVGQDVIVNEGALLDLDIPVNRGPRGTCPGCRNRCGFVPIVMKPVEKPKPPPGLRGGFTDDPDIKNLREYVLKEGEEFRFHPWILFRDKIARQIERDQHGRYYARVVFKVGGVDYPYYFPILHVGDVVLQTFGPAVVVHADSKSKQWPLNWNSEMYLQYAGEAAIRFYHGSTNFNVEHVKNKMMEILSRDIPLWECVEHDCIAWIQSPLARDAENRMAQYHLRNKKHAERLLYVRKLMSSKFTESEIAILLLYFDNYDTMLFLLQVLLVLALISFSWCAHHIATVGIPFGRLFLASMLGVMVYRLNVLLCAFSIDDLPRVKMANIVHVAKSCSLGVKLPDLHASAKLKIPRAYDIPCEDKRSIEVYGTIIKGMPFVVPKCCVHDVVNGLRIRFLFERPWHTGTEDVPLLRFAMKFLSETRWATWVQYTHLDWWFHLSGGRRATMLREDDHAPLSDQNWVAKIFVKCEAYVGKTWKSFKPRIIQCRSSSLQILIGAFFYSVYKFIASTFSSVSGKNVYAVACNALELGFIVSTMQGDLYEADASNWDGSVTQTFLRIEKFFIDKILPYRPIWMDELMKKWCITKGASQKVRYSCDWGRRSGDMWTSAFNTLLNIIITNFVWDGDLNQAVFNGDDNFFSVRPGANAEAALAKYSALGLKMVLVPRQSWQTLEFCSGLFYPTYRGVKWGLKPFRQLAKFGVNFNRHSKKQFAELLLSSCLSMLPIAGHVPIFGIILRRIVATSRATPSSQQREEWQITDTVVDDIHPSAIELFKVRYGYSDEEYSRLERWACSVKASDFPMVLEDELFTRGARVDMGTELLDTDHPDCGDLWYTVEGEKKQPKNVFETISPFLEEFVGWKFPISWAYVGAIETFLGSFYALPTHFLLSRLRVYTGPFATLIVHLLFNAFVGRANLLSYLQYDGNVFRDLWKPKPIRGNQRTEALRMPGVFTSMSDCVGILNNRLTDCGDIVLHFGERVTQWLNGFSARKNNSRSRTKKVTTVVVKTKRQRNRGNRRVNTPHPFVLAQVNPFLAEVDGVRIPDSFAYPTASVILRAANVISTGSVYVTGSAAAYSPHLIDYYLNPSSITAGGTLTWTGPTAFAMPQQSAMNAAFSSFRLVAGGIRISTEQSLTTAAGHLWVAHVPIDIDADQYGISYFPTTEAGIAALPLAEKYPMAELATRPLIVPFRRTESASYRFRDCQYPASASPYVETNTGWCAIIVYTAGIAGGASTAHMNVETIFHVEALHRGSTGTLLTPDITVCPPNPQAMIVAETVGMMQPSAHVESTEEENGVDAWFDRVEKILNRGARLVSGIAAGGMSAYSAYSKYVAPRKARANNFIEYAE